MAYARLFFPSAGITSIPQKRLKDIAKFCTGAVSSVADLEFAFQANSTVITTEPAGWTMADAASALESTGVATITEYRLQAPCVNTSKIKYCALSAWNTSNFSSTSSNTNS